MPSGTSGALITCDIPIKEFLIWLDEKQSEKFIIADLDESYLFVQSRAVTFIKTELDNLYKENQFSFIEAENNQEKKS